MNTLNDFSVGLNKKGSFANDLVNDTIVLNSLQLSAKELQAITTKRMHLLLI